MIDKIKQGYIEAYKDGYENGYKDGCRFGRYDCKKIIIPLIEHKKKKLDYRGIEESLIDNKGIGTKKFHTFGFCFIDEKPSEKKETEKYEISFEIGIKDKDYRFLVGQKGLYLKTTDKEYTAVKNEIDESKKFVQFCNKFMFYPVGTHRFSDGLYYKKSIHEQY